MGAVQRVKIFVSSPSDLAAERQAIVRAIERLNRQASIRERFVLDVLLYEHEAVPLQARGAQSVVDTFMDVRTSYAVICLFWSRMGTSFTHQGESYRSGTEYEFLTAYREHEKTNAAPYVLLYRKTAPPPANADPTQQAEVNAFFRQFDSPNARFRGLRKSFETTGQIEQMIYEHLDKLIAKYPPSPIDNLATEATQNDSLPSLRVSVGGDNVVRGTQIIGNTVQATVVSEDPALKRVENDIRKLEQQGAQMDRALGESQRKLQNLRARRSNRTPQQSGETLVLWLLLIGISAGFFIFNSPLSPFVAAGALVAGVIWTQRRKQHKQDANAALTQAENEIRQINQKRQQTMNMIRVKEEEKEKLLL
ncbi:MAG: DUF4062 domain-containing protein [Chloroflexota bacterium]|nr:DUF4062 domain-containing protein [Chloroflexota bacterium]